MLRCFRKICPYYIPKPAFWQPSTGQPSRPIAPPSLAADLLDRLNERLTDAEYAIGPSYLMRKEIYENLDDGLADVWRHDILPLLVEYHYADRINVHERYGLDALRSELM